MKRLVVRNAYPDYILAENLHKHDILGLETVSGRKFFVVQINCGCFLAITSHGINKNCPNRVSENTYNTAYDALDGIGGKIYKFDNQISLFKWLAEGGE